MVCKISWSPEAIRTYLSTLEYLETNWTDTEVANFITRVDSKLNILKTHPLSGSISGKRKNTFRTIIHKRIVLYYHYAAGKKQIELVSFWNTLQNPRKLKI